MVYINEWFPNPTGNDAAGEFVELYNGGDTAVSLRGWSLATESGKKKLSFTDQKIGPRGYLVLKKSATKLSLRNTDGGIFLYDARGATEDRGNFYGSAMEGKSFSRVDYGTPPNFAFVDPTPGAPNKKVDIAIATEHYVAGMPLNQGLDIGGFFAIMIGVAGLLTGLALYIVKTHEDLSELFFGGNKEYR